MPLSMTAYGTGSASDESLTATVEIRSVNNRFLDLNIRTPRALFPFEGEIRDFLQRRLTRGRVTLAVTESWVEGGSDASGLDLLRARHYLRQLQTLSRELKLEGDVRLDHLIRFEDIFVPDESAEFRSKLWELTKKAMDTALAAFIQVAEREGQMLCADVESRIASIEQEVSGVKKLASQQPELYQQRLRERLGELLDDSRLDRNRLETEVALAADRLDVTEEIVRLESHLGLFRAALKEEGAIGKKLGFVQQEMGREANTIASKSWDAELSQSAIRIKEVVEQIREQIQNIA